MRPLDCQYYCPILILHNKIDRLWIILKGCAIYWVNQKWFDFYCAIWKIMHRLWAALRNIASGSLERSCSEHLREWIIMATKAKEDEGKFILERIEVYHSLPALWNDKSKDYSNRIKKNEQYEHLLRKYRERFPDADKNQLIKKFNSLHTNFRKGLKQIKGFNSWRNNF